jgi:enoyl-CoA hydratase
MGYTCFEVEETEGVAHVRLSRPDAYNTMIPAFWAELPEIVGGLSDSGRVRAVVLSSTGKHFSAGMDLAVFTGGDAGTGDGERITEIGRQRAALRYNVLHLQRSFTVLEQARMPVLAAIQGGCIGGAVDMVTAADCRYASADAFFCIQEINIAMTADVGTLQRLPTLVPEGVVRELAYTGRRMPAEEAHAVGLVNRVFDDHASLVDGVHEIAAEIASKSPLAVHGTKETLRYARDHTVEDALEYIAVWQTGMFQPTDMMEVFAAKAEGREPVFDDLGPVNRGL